MSKSEKFVFDTAGYIVVEGVLTSQEVDELNRAIDHQLPLLHPAPSAPMSGRTLSMIGDRNLHALIADYINTQRGSSLTALEVMDQLKDCGFPAPSRTVSFGQALSTDERQAIAAEMQTARSEQTFISTLENFMAPDGESLSALSSVEKAVRGVTFSFLCNYSRNTGLLSRDMRH
eukprot:SAG31_NODE_859_length_11432_cov_5.450631_3_plen_175_part_00